MPNPYPFVLSYARDNAVVSEPGEPPQPDAPFEAFLQRLNQHVRRLTGAPGFVDRNNILAGQDWPDELAEALRTAHTLVCLYSPAYFRSDWCGKEMQVFLDRRREYIRANGGKKPANIIPVPWLPTPRRVPKTLPEIQYPAPKVEPKTQGAWNLGDDGRDNELKAFADQIAIRVRDAADETPLPALPQRPRINAVRSAFRPPPLPLPEFDTPDATMGPDAVTFVYASSMRWDAWPFAPPEERAVLHLAAAVAKGKEMESTQLSFGLADANLSTRLTALRQRNNVVILLVDAGRLTDNGLRARMREYDHEEFARFGTIVLNKDRIPDVRVQLAQALPYFARRAEPNLYVVETDDGFTEKVTEALAGLRLAVLNDPQDINPVENRSAFQSLPTLNGAGRLPVQ